MSFPSTPAQGQTATINGVVYSYTSATNSWTRSATPTAGVSVSSSGPITLNGDQNLGANNMYNSGSSSAEWASVYAVNFVGQALTAKYADLAEIYEPDAEYDPGTVLVFGGRAEVTTTDIEADHRVAGVVSTNPAYLMNTTAEGVAVALRGRVPCQVIGKVAKGDLLVTSDVPGYAKSVGSDKSYGPAVFAKALTHKDSSYLGTIEAVIL